MTEGRRLLEKYAKMCENDAKICFLLRRERCQMRKVHAVSCLGLEIAIFRSFENYRFLSNSYFFHISKPRQQTGWTFRIWQRSRRSRTHIFASFPHSFAYCSESLRPSVMQNSREVSEKPKRNSSSCNTSWSVFCSPFALRFCRRLGGVCWRHRDIRQKPRSCLAE